MKNYRKFLGYSLVVIIFSYIILNFINNNNKPSNKLYSSAIKTNNTLYIAGQTPNDTITNEIVGNTIEEQTEKVFEIIGGILKENNLNFNDVVSTTVYLSDLNNKERMNKIYGKYFSNSPTPPARTAIQISRLPGDAQIEISAIASYSNKVVIK